MHDELLRRLREPCQYENCVLCKEAADAIEERDRFALPLQHEMMAEAESHIALVERLNKRIEELQKQEHEEKEIVYCKDCAYLGFKDFYGICEDGPMTGIVQPWDYCSKGVRKKPKEEKGDKGMTYLRAIRVCQRIEEYSEEEALQAIEKILGMATINAVSKDALLNVVRWFWKRCVTTTEEAERQQEEEAET